MGLLSGGIGITPLRSMCKYSTDLQLDADIALLYGNNSEKDIIFKKEFEEMQKRNKKLKVVYTVNEPQESWIGHTGKIAAEMVKQEIPDYLERTFYICGPPKMVAAMKILLKDLGISLKQIKQENFSGY